MPAAEKIVDLYQRHAANYLSDRGKTLFEKPWLDKFLKLVPAQGSILDVGCGPGEPLARYFSETGYRVTGVDSSSAMIELCKTRLPDEDWIVADMRSLSVDRVFNGILAWDSIFHLCPDDQRIMFPIFGKHAAPAAALMFTSGTSSGDAIGCYRGEPLYHSSLEPEEYRSLLDKNGFDVVSHVVEDPTCGRHTIWLAQLR